MRPVRTTQGCVFSIRALLLFVTTMTVMLVRTAAWMPMSQAVRHLRRRHTSWRHSPWRRSPLRQTSRLLGSKAGSGGASGAIDLYDEQKALTSLDLPRLRTTVQRIRHLIGYDTYDVTLLLVDDKAMTATNLESRSIDAPTDILSFPFHGAISPGTLEDVPFDIPDYYMLGDMVVDVPYVMRRCQEDKEDIATAADDDDDETDDRGVSGAMAPIYDAETRIEMLLVHGMLHLVGYDHEDEEDYALMVAREEEILRELGMPLPAAASQA